MISICLVTESCPNLCDSMDCSMSDFPVHHQLPELTQNHIHQIGDTIQWSHPLSSPSPPTFNLSQHQGLFIWVSFSHQIAKVWSFSFSISPFNEYSGLISFRIEWLDLLAVQGILKSLLQHHSSKASILRCSTFFIVQLSHPYMTIGKTTALIRQTFVGRVTFLLSDMLSRLVIACLPRSKHILFPWATESLQMVTSAMKLKMLASWRKSYDKPRQHIKKQRFCRQRSVYSVLWFFQ